MSGVSENAKGKQPARGKKAATAATKNQTTPEELIEESVNWRGCLVVDCGLGRSPSTAADHLIVFEYSKNPLTSQNASNSG